MSFYIWIRYQQIKGNDRGQQQRGRRKTKAHLSSLSLTDALRFGGNATLRKRRGLPLDVGLSMISGCYKFAQETGEHVSYWTGV